MDVEPVYEIDDKREYLLTCHKDVEPYITAKGPIVSIRRNAIHIIKKSISEQILRSAKQMIHDNMRLG